MCCSKFNLLLVSTQWSFTLDAILISLKPIQKISFVLSYFILLITMVWNFSKITVIFFSLNQFNGTSNLKSKDSINSWMVLLKQVKVLPSAKLCAVANKII